MHPKGSKMNRARRLAFPRRLLAQFFVMSILGSHLLAANPAAPNSSDQGTSTEKLILRDHWTLESSAKVEAKGEIVSTAAFVP
jgi:hypothetical protein